VARYKNLPYPLEGPNVKRVPNVLFAIAKDSRDHSREVYQDVVGPMMSKIDPAPHLAVTRFEASTHFYHRAEEGLPLGIGPAVAQHFHEGITRGFFTRT
jgi:hypothetical protein